MSLRIVVADDQELVRAGLSGILRSAPDLCVVGEAANGREAVTLARTERPHLVLMDIRMPELDGIEATRRITADQDIKVLILTTFDHDEYVYSALRGGASGFLLKDTPPRQLIEAVHAVATGETLLSPAITRRLIARFTARPPAAPVSVSGLESLTAREREVLALVAEGLTNDEIARRLYISPGTAKTHVRHLLAKLDARDRVHLVIIAYQAGLPAAWLER
ncbi:response regulator transcription factor [Actinocrinis sp.]|uniref:response regulator transcription factor n=1 Tax=Actinocrinis sp. TaxID=1920516 RepID=UPI002BB314AA|nr:response regulator transcription factor [Actinocrinis sp.]HXR71049.1 response regulator transcription factor [Actinocrinis sp.]